eukprot:CAMPEP_0171980792 /NCGR_PEP_ID=MMETSP0993-20121228/263393_1 /TAXON_ID=483369 /ORGANISM="non described non described, Strain CCMP2098" /LENGTH=88 /DNA_ID=CAMNT_0012633121 /DNA_START=65 /DNA_END=327 /DNA_ORIENTATION=+
MTEHNALLRYGSLALLVAQDTALVLLLRSSREGSADGTPMYLASTAVLIMETIKLSCCGLMILQGPAAFDVSSWFEIVSKDVLDYVEV